MVFTCDGFYGRKAQPRALYSRRLVNVKVSHACLVVASRAGHLAESGWWPLGLRPERR